MVVEEGGPAAGMTNEKCAVRIEEAWLEMLDCGREGLIEPLTANVEISRVSTCPIEQALVDVSQRRFDEGAGF